MNRSVAVWNRALSRWSDGILVALVVLLGLALSLAPLKVVFAGLAGAVGLFCLLIWPQSIVVPLAFAVPFGALGELSIGPLNVGGVEFAVAILLALWFASSAVRQRIIIPRQPLTLPLLGFLGALFVSSYGAVSIELSAKEIFKWFEVLVVYLFVSSLLDRRWARILVVALIGAGASEALLGIWQSANGIGPPGFLLFGRFMRAFGHFAQPNPFAGYLGLTQPFALALCFFVPSLLLRRRRLSLGAWLARIAPLCAAVGGLGVMVVAMSLSLSRGAWMGAIAAASVMLLAYARRRMVILMAIAGLAVGVIALGGTQYVPASISQRVIDFLPYAGGVDIDAVEVNDANWAVIERMAHWQAAVDMFSQSPWLGVGIGNYPAVYLRYAPNRWTDPLGHAHNYYLNIAAETGVVGLLAFLVLMGAALWQCLSAVMRTSGYWKAVALGALGVAVHLSVHNLVDTLFVHGMAVQFALVLGLLPVAERETVRDAHWD